MAQPTPRHLQRLLAERERLATAAAVADAHGHLEAADLAARQYALEATIQTISRRRHALLSPEWVLQDALRAHTPDQPQPDTCSICADTALGQQPHARTA